MKVNWGAKFRNRVWLTAFVAQLFIVAQLLLVGANELGLTDFKLTEAIQSWLLAVFNSVLVVLTTLGIIHDTPAEEDDPGNQ